MHISEFQQTVGTLPLNSIELIQTRGLHSLITGRQLKTIQYNKRVKNITLRNSAITTNRDVV